MEIYLSDPGSNLSELAKIKAAVIPFRSQRTNVKSLNQIERTVCPPIKDKCTHKHYRIYYPQNFDFKNMHRVITLARGLCESSLMSACCIPFLTANFLFLEIFFTYGLIKNQQSLGVKCKLIYLQLRLDRKRKISTLTSAHLLQSYTIAWLQTCSLFLGIEPLPFTWFSQPIHMILARDILSFIWKYKEFEDKKRKYRRVLDLKTKRRYF